MTTSRELIAQMSARNPMPDLNLARIQSLLAAQGFDERDLAPVIHVAGTNGKGSVIAFLRAILHAAGFAVHSYTSPYLESVHESIQLAGKGNSASITEHHLTALLQRIEPNTVDLDLTPFEIETAAAFLAFSEQPADIVLLEAGLGGAGDATNIISKPALTILTPIALDHTEFLGNSHADVARAKAGILKPGTPCIVARQPDKVRDVIEEVADQRGIVLSRHGQEWDAFQQQGRLVFQSAERLIDLPLPQLSGPHQLDNAGIAIAAIQALPWLDIGEAEIAHGISNTVWAGRLERVPAGGLHDACSDDAEIWLDGGHNSAAGWALAHAMAEKEDRAPKPLHLIVGMLTSKDPAAFLEPFEGLAECVIAVPVHPAPSAFRPSFAPQELAAEVRNTGLVCHVADDLVSALALSKRLAHEPSRILICGSLHLVAQAQRLNMAAPAAE